MATRHEQKVCDICGLPYSTYNPIKAYTYPGRLQVIEAHPMCVSELAREVMK